MAEITRFFDSVAGDRKYSAADMGDTFLQALGFNGVVTKDNSLEPTNSGTAFFYVDTGTCWFSTFIYKNTAKFGLALDAVTSGQKRYDRLVIRFDSLTTRAGAATIIKGAEAVSPTLPSITSATDLSIGYILIDNSSGTPAYTVFDDRTLFFEKKARRTYYANTTEAKTNTDLDIIFNSSSAIAYDITAGAYFKGSKCKIKNQGTGTLTITYGTSLTYSLTAGQVIEFIWSGIWTLWNDELSIGLPIKYGLQISNDVSTPTTVLDIAAGFASDSTNSLIMRAGAFTKTVSAWAVGTGNGGLDTGSIAANTAYAVWMIIRPDTGIVDYLFSTSFTAPTMPSNYTLKRLIGMFCTKSGAATIATAKWSLDNTFYYLDPSEWAIQLILGDTNSDLGTTATVSINRLPNTLCLMQASHQMLPRLTNTTSGWCAYKIFNQNETLANLATNTYGEIVYSDSGGTTGQYGNTMSWPDRKQVATQGTVTNPVYTYDIYGANPAQGNSNSASLLRPDPYNNWSQCSGGQLKFAYRTNSNHNISMNLILKAVQLYL